MYVQKKGKVIPSWLCFVSSCTSLPLILSQANKKSHKFPLKVKRKISSCDGVWTTSSSSKIESLKKNSPLPNGDLFFFPKLFVLIKESLKMQQHQQRRARLEDFLGIEQIQSGPWCFSIYFDGDDMFTGVDWSNSERERAYCHPTLQKASLGSYVLLVPPILHLL